MRIPITKYGLPQVAIYPAVILAMMIIYFIIVRWGVPKSMCPCWTIRIYTLLIPEVLLLIVLIWMLCFFRDPFRQCPQDSALLLSPADGTISNVEIMESYEGFDGPVMRIEIFLSIFNVHINRMPCAVKVGTVTYKPGKFLDARSPDCHKVNEANELELFRQDEPADRLLVRQISGAIARRIVCEAKTDRTFTAGEKFGMIKFGSCTELFLPARDNAECKVQKGDKVKAGLTVLVQYE